MNFQMNRDMSNALRRGFRNGATGMADHGRMDHPLSNDELRQYAPSVFAEAAHESRSARFKAIPTLSVIEGLRKEGFMPFQAKQAKTRDEGRVDYTKHLIRFRRGADNNGSWRNDEAIPEIVLVNANDGTSSYQLYGGLFRTLCLNGLIVAESMIQSVKISHKGDIVGQVIEGSYRVLDNTALAVEAQKAWAGIELQPREALAFAEAAHELRFERDDHGNPQGAGMAIKAPALLQVQRRGDEGRDLWTTFNRVQENVLKGGLHGHQAGRMEDGVWKGPRRVTTKAVNGIDQDVKLNKALWSLAEKMAELKAA